MTIITKPLKTPQPGFGSPDYKPEYFPETDDMKKWRDETDPNKKEPSPRWPDDLDVDANNVYPKGE